VHSIASPSEGRALDELRFGLVRTVSEVPEERRGRITLALSVLNIPAHPIAESMSERLRDWVADLGFSSMWLVGSTLARLDHGQA
jgi:hypothetical protein